MPNSLSSALAALAHSSGKKLAVIAALSVSIAAGVAVPAAAHEGWIFHGYDKAGMPGGAPHRHLDWCDEESDGNRVRARGNYNISGNPEWATAWDPDGAGGSCGHVSETLAAVWWHKVCEENVSCTERVYH